MEYQGNSDKSKKEEPVKPKKDLEKVVKGTVVVKQAPLGERFKRVFLGGDLKDARGYVLEDVILPAFRQLLVDAVIRGSERLVFGTSGRRRPTTHGSTYSPRISYNRVSSPLGRESALLPNQPARRWEQTGTRNQEDVIVSSKEDGETVIEAMTTIVDQYEVVSLADLNELLGLPSSPIENKWGWTNLSSLNLSQTRQGWQISFPPLEDIS